MFTPYIKAVESDRRFSKTLPNLDLDPVVTHRILALAADSDLLEGMTTIQPLWMVVWLIRAYLSEVAKRPLDEPEDKVIARLGVTYGVLRRLGFEETRVDKCLRSIHGVDLDEAYEWVRYRFVKLFNSVVDYHIYS